MALHWTDKRRAQVLLGYALQQRGWKLWGYSPDRSDSMTDYYCPATWDGVATHEAHPGVIVGVMVSQYEVNRHSGKPEMSSRQERGQDCVHCGGTGVWPVGLTYEQAKANPLGQHFNEYCRLNNGCNLMPKAVSPLHYFENGQPRCLFCHGQGYRTVSVPVEGETWPIFGPTPRGYLWHVESAGQVIAKGKGVAAIAEHAYSSGDGADKAVQQVVSEIEHALEPGVRSIRVEPVAMASGSELSYEGDWTWLRFASKPDEGVRTALKAAGARFSGKRSAWYFTRHVERPEVEALLPATA